MTLFNRKILSRWVDNNKDFMISAGHGNTAADEYIVIHVGADYDEEEQQDSGEDGTDSLEATYSSELEVDNEVAMTSDYEEQADGDEMEQQQGE